MRYREKNGWFLFCARGDKVPRLNGVTPGVWLGEGVFCRAARQTDQRVARRRPAGKAGAPGISGNHGYTLLEVLISLFLFIAIAVPMLTGVVTNTGALRSQEALTAVYILEQEAAFARLFPEDVPLVKHRAVNGKSWTVTIDALGSPLRKFEMVAMHNGKKCGKAIVYGMMGEK